MTHERGFTLIETLVAFAILAVTLTALYASLGTGMRALERAGNAEDAALLAQSKLEEVRIARTLPDEAVSAMFDGTPYRWTLMPVTEPPDPNAPTAAVVPRHLRLSIAWQEDGRTRHLDVDTIVLVRTALGK